SRKYLWQRGPAGERDRISGCSVEARKAAQLGQYIDTPIVEQPDLTIIKIDRDELDGRPESGAKPLDRVDSRLGLVEEACVGRQYAAKRNGCQGSRVHHGSSSPLIKARECSRRGRASADRGN